MLSFKKYLSEDLLSEGMISDIFFDHIFQTKLILSKPFTDKIQTNLTGVDGLHITSGKGLEQLESIQKSQKQISASLRTSYRQIGEGIATRGGFLVSLRGDILYYQPYDAFTDRLPGGRRAISLPYFSGLDAHQRRLQKIVFNLIFNNLRQKHHEVLFNVANNTQSFLNATNHGEPFTDIDDFLDVLREWTGVRDEYSISIARDEFIELLNIFKEKSGMEREVQRYKSLIIAKYIERSEEYVQRTPELIEKLIPGEPLDDMNDSYDEMLMVNFQIKQVYYTYRGGVDDDLIKKFNAKKITEDELEELSEHNIAVYNIARKELIDRIQRA